jgi:hypothetical protein
MFEHSKLSPQQRQRLQQLVERGVLPALEAWARSMTAPIWWKGQAGLAPYQGGTVCFVHTGIRVLGVTAEHVHRKAVEHSAQEWCQVGAHTFDPVKRCIDADPTLDICTYDFTEVSTNAAGADIHYAQKWPPSVADGDPALACGWPWELSETSGAHATHSFLHFLCRIQQSSPSQLGIATFTSTSVPWGSIPLPQGTNLGGMSGGPVFRIVEAPLSQLHLVGIIHQYQPNLELILARPLSLINADGTIIR